MKDGIRWTEKVQAIAAIIAILGGIAGFYKLFSSDKELQQQIDNLSVMTKQSVAQTEILQGQLNVLSERNRILVEQLEIDRDKWIKQIRPEFVIKLDDYLGGIGTNNMITVEKVPIINKGSAAFILRVEPNENNQCQIKLAPTFIPKQGSSAFDITFEKGKNFFDFNLYYKDIDGNIYSQRFNGLAGWDDTEITSHQPKRIE